MFTEISNVSDPLLPLVIDSQNLCTGLGLKLVARLRECRRLSQAEVVSKNRNKIHQSWGPPFSGALFLLSFFADPHGDFKYVGSPMAKAVAEC